MKRRVESSHGVSYLEMLFATLILALCSGFICDAMAFGFAHLREREKGNSAAILLDLLCAAVRNDLEYATEWRSDNSFARTVPDGESGQALSVITWYGTGRWLADNEESCYDAEAIQWREIHDESARPGELIRKSKLSDGYYFDCVAPPECYSGYGGMESGLYAKMELLPPDTEAQGLGMFTVTILIYDGADILAQRTFAVIPVQPIAFKD